MVLDNSKEKGLTYFGGKTWRKSITRDERFFCAHLYQRILEDGNKGVLSFVKLINKKCSLELPEDTYWELGYEVCLYRDLWYWRKHIKKEKEVKLISPKRTFDLCLFSNEAVVIIEAKAFQGFEDEQMESFEKDKNDVCEVLESVSRDNIFLIGLACDSYINSSRLSERVKSCFKDGLLSWNNMVEQFKGTDGSNDSILERADQMHKMRLNQRTGR